jgi:hypothetical protein
MQGAYGGLIVIIMYAGAEAAQEQEFALITQDNLFILTQNSDEILATEEV